ncbi:MAG: hypothetical protein ACRDSH_20695, partial [Pseudonocardiaceae bacterium]
MAISLPYRTRDTRECSDPNKKMRHRLVANAIPDAYLAALAMECGVGSLGSGRRRGGPGSARSV